MPTTSRGIGSVYALAATVLIAAQAPFSSSAARSFSVFQFLFLTQIGLLASVPLLLLSAESRCDLPRALKLSNAGKLGIIFAVSAAGLVLYNVSLMHAHPVVVVAILNLGPFWGAAVAWVLSRTPIPVSRAIFFGCLAAAFAGALAVAWSQSGGDQTLGAELMEGGWLFALPIPLFTVLSASLTTRWFSDLNASAAVAANLLLGVAVMIPTTFLILLFRGESLMPGVQPTLLMIVGIILADSTGRVFYQKALNATGNDNGFVTAFQNLEPAIAAVISLGLSPFVKGLRFEAGWLFFAGLGATAAGLFVFSWASLWRPNERGPQLIKRTLAPRL